MSEALEEEQIPIDYRFDIDALFAYLTGEEVGHQLEDELDWSFGLRSHDVELLKTLADELEADFAGHVQDTIKEEGDDGSIVQGNPILVLVKTAAMTPEEVKSVADQLQGIAGERGLVYEGVDCCDPIDYEEIFGWFQPEETISRLQNMTANGLAPDIPLPWTFLLQSPSAEANKAIMAALAEADMSDIDEFDEPDEDGKFGLCVFAAGTNNESAIEETQGRIAEIVARFDGLIDGVQFYTREEVGEVFSEDDEVEDEGEVAGEE